MIAAGGVRARDEPTIQRRRHDNLRVLLFTTCLVGELEASTGAAAARLLRGLGVDVHVPAGQTCCGQPAYNAGHVGEAQRIARHTLDVLESADAVVLPSGSCATMVRHHYPRLFASDTVSASDDVARARALANRTYELSEFIVRVLKRTTLGDGLRGRRVAYHHGCHGLRELGVRDEPLRLLRNAGATVVEWEAAEECCGFGGLFSVKLPEVSGAMADRKLDTLSGASPDVLTSADAGCLLHLEGRMRRRGGSIETRHLAHLLLEAAVGPG
jgi:L-lactate dehydrogenase complex protein LldE